MVKKSSSLKKTAVNTAKISLWISKQNFSKENICRQMKISYPLLWKIENGYRTSLKYALRFSEFTGKEISIEDLGWKIERKENYD